MFFCRCASNSQDSPKASPRKLISNETNWYPRSYCWNECWIERWPYKRQYVLSSLWQHVTNIAVCQLCRERQPFWNSHDGRDLTCLDQCHGVRSHCSSSSQGWCKKRLYSLHSPNLIHEDTSLFSPKVSVAGLPRKAFPRKPAFVDISVFLWLRKQQPRQPKGYFQTKELDRTTEAFARMNVVWEGGEVS